MEIENEELFKMSLEQLKSAINEFKKQEQKLVCDALSLSEINPEKAEELYVQAEGYLIKRLNLQELLALKKDPFTSDNEIDLYIIRDIEKKDHLHSQNGASFFITLHDEKKIIGRVGYGIYVEEQTAEIHADIEKSYQGKSYGKKALELLKPIITAQKIKKIIARTFPDNIPAQKVAKKFGFQEMDNPNLNQGIECICYEYNLSNKR